MAGEQFRVQELNPLLEWHPHTTAMSLESTSPEATRIAVMIDPFCFVLTAKCFL